MSNDTAGPAPHLGSKDIERFLEVGARAFLDSDPMAKDAKRQEAMIVGWRREAYILFEMPLGNDASRPLRQNRLCVIRYMSNGRACAFEANVLDWRVDKSYPVFRVSWPHEIRYMNLRRHPRIATDLLCEASINNRTNVWGNLLDISLGGCRFYVPVAVRRDARIAVSFTLPNGVELGGVAAEVRHTYLSREGMGVGAQCDFSRLADGHRRALEFFIQTTVERQGAQGVTAPRVLFLDRNREQVAAIEPFLKRRRVDVLVASELIEGIGWLQVSGPAAMFINAEQGEMSALDVCRLIKNTATFKNMPVVIYGGNDPLLKQLATSAGAMGYFPNLSDDEALLHEVIDEATKAALV